MLRRRPMDRLVCGDVGYGKTEVALRAAFKAVQDGKQVAVLVPTTVLAQQHELTFERRLASFPVRVEMLSRFVSRKRQEQIVEGKDLLARAFQHEMDHLDGMLFVDRIRGIKRDLIVKKIRKLTRAGKW